MHCPVVLLHHCIQLSMLPDRTPTPASADWALFCADVLHASSSLSVANTPRAVRCVQNLESVRLAHFETLSNRSVGTYKWTAADLGWVAAASLRMALAVDQECSADAFQGVERAMLAVCMKPLSEYGRWECTQALHRLLDAWPQLYPGGRGLHSYIAALETVASRVALSAAPDIDFVRWCGWLFYELRLALLPTCLTVVEHDEAVSEALHQFWDSNVQHFATTAGARKMIVQIVRHTLMRPGDISLFANDTGEDPTSVDVDRAVRQLHGASLSVLTPMIQSDALETWLHLLTGQQYQLKLAVAFDAYLYSKHRIASFFVNTVIMSVAPHQLHARLPYIVVVAGCAGVVHAGELHLFRYGGMVAAIQYYMRVMPGRMFMQRHFIPAEVQRAFIEL